MNHIKLFEENWNKNYTDNSWLEYIRSLHNFNVGDTVYVTTSYELNQDFETFKAEYLHSFYKIIY